MGNYGIKVTTANSDIGTADPRTISMSSSYTMFKIHSDGTQTGTITGGVTGGTVNFIHGLGYVPAFWTYYIGNDGKQRLLSNLPEGIGYTGNITSFAGTNNLTCVYDLGSVPNQIGPYTWTSAYEDFLGFSFVQVGKLESGLSISSGVVFGSVNIGQGVTIGTAMLNFYVQSKGTNTADGTLKFFGIDSDNITTINDLNSTETTAGGTQNVANIGLGESFGMNVTSCVQEIVNRSGWSSGNGMGFHIRDVNFPNGKLFIDVTNNSTLTIYLPGGNTFTFRTIIFKDKIY
jgi:hypothetical protein